jgi:hypothetical protein
MPDVTNPHLFGAKSKSHVAVSNREPIQPKFLPLETRMQQWSKITLPYTEIIVEFYPSLSGKNNVHM